MSPRPPPSTSESAQAEPDLDSTAELSPLDAAALGLVMDDEPVHGPPGGPVLPTLTASGSRPLPAGGERLAQVERERDAARTALELAEQRLAATADEMAQARALVSASSERTLELQRRLEQLESESKSKSEGQGRVPPDRQPRGVEPTQTAALAEALEHRARAAIYLEALQGAEGRRLISESLVGDLQREAAAREADLGRLNRELAGRSSAATDRDEELERRAAHIARLEQQLASLKTTLAGRETLLPEAQQATEGLQVSVARLQQELAAGAERARALETLAEQFRATEAQQRRELEQLSAERAQLSTQLESALATASVASAAAARAEPEVSGSASSPERLTQLEAAVVAKHQRIAQLEGELTKLRAEMSEWGGVLRTAQAERDQHLAGVGAAEARAHALQRDVTERGEAIRLLQTQGDAHTARARELEADLRAAEDTIRRLESDLRTRSARIEELERSNSQWRATLEEARLGSTDPALRRLGVRPPPAAPPPQPQPVTEGACVLIQTRRGREITHRLGRKTSIGRTPDNDLQIDAKVVSRHHAVILVGPAETVIEDLNSTNGVLVNGQRVIRQTLKDGDQLVIGRERYRFALRKADKR